MMKRLPFVYLILISFIHVRLRFGRRADPDVPRVSAVNQHDWGSDKLQKQQQQNKIHVKLFSYLIAWCIQ